MHILCADTESASPLRPKKYTCQRIVWAQTQHAWIGLLTARQVAPEILQELHATNFVHEVAKLTLRYQAGQSKGADKLPDQSGLPDEYMDALIQSLDIQCERFASPLNFNPAVKRYYSLHEHLEPMQMPHD